VIHCRGRGELPSLWCSQARVANSLGVSRASEAIVLPQACGSYILLNVVRVGGNPIIDIGYGAGADCTSTSAGRDAVPLTACANDGRFTSLNWPLEPCARTFSGTPSYPRSVTPRSATGAWRTRGFPESSEGSECSPKGRHSSGRTSTRHHLERHLARMSAAGWHQPRVRVQR